MVTLSIKNLTKKYGNTKVIDDFDITVESGEFMVLLGPSGCGKTTVLRCIAGLISPTNGQIFLGDRQITNLSPKERDIAMVFQNYALYPHMTVYDNIAFPLKMRKKTKSHIHDKVLQTVELLGIKDLLDRKPKELSGGQMQRVALGRALVREPKLFLMDEPLSNLDAKLRSHMRTEIKKLQKQVGITTLYITHDQLEAMSMADRIGVMKGGKLQQIDKPLGVYTRPLNTFVAQFVGSPPINLLDSSIHDNELKTLSGELSLILNDELRNLEKFMHVVIGIRPRDILILEDNDKSITDLRFQGIVNFIEMLGDDLVIEFTVGTSKLIVSTSDITLHLSIGSRVNLGLNISKIIFFDTNGKILDCTN